MDHLLQSLKRNEIGINNNFRFANLFNLNSLGVDKIETVVKTVKTETSPDLSCDGNSNPSLLSVESMLSQVKAVEQILQIESSDQIYDTMTNEELKTAAKMFLYLSTCPKHDKEWFKSWYSFYKDLFLTKSADKIILTLNRMIKTETHDKDGKLRTEKLLKRTSSLMSLSFEKIQSLLPGKKLRNGSVNKDFMIQNGKHFL